MTLCFPLGLQLNHPTIKEQTPRSNRVQVLKDYLGPTHYILQLTDPDKGFSGLLERKKIKYVCGLMWQIRKKNAT